MDDNMDDEKQHDSRFLQLNWFGKAVFLGGTALRLSANLIDGAVKQASSIAVEAREAYQRELDPNIEDAKILEEKTLEERAEPHDAV